MGCFLPPTQKQSNLDFSIFSFTDDKINDNVKQVLFPNVILISILSRKFISRYTSLGNIRRAIARVRLPKRLELLRHAFYRTRSSKF